MFVGIGIGSNLGSRQDHMDRAVEHLRARGSKVRVADPLETEPVDCPPGSPAFLNTVVILEYSGDLIELLDFLQDMERAAGREEEAERQRNAPRPLDLDILFCDHLMMESPRLTLPHPRMMDRRFVLEPLAQLAPDFRPFPDGPTVLERLETLS